MASPVADLQVYVGKSLEATKQELEGLGYTVNAFGVAICTFSDKPAEDNLPSVGVTPADPNKPIEITYNADDSQQRVRTISQH